MKPQKFLYFFIVMLGTMTAAKSGTVVFNSSVPTTNVILSNTTTSANAISVHNFAGAGQDRWVEFGFEAPTSTTLNSVTYMITSTAFGTAVPGSSVTLSLISLASATGTPGAPATPFSPLLSDTATVPSTYSSQGYFTFTLSTPFSLTATDDYGIVLAFNDPTDPNKGMNLLEGTAPSGNVGGVYFTSDAGSTYTVIPSSSLDFVLQTASVPEPSPLMLSFGAFAAGAVLFRRRLFCRV